MLRKLRALPAALLLLLIADSSAGQSAYPTAGYASTASPSFPPYDDNDWPSTVWEPGAAEPVPFEPFSGASSTAAPGQGDSINLDLLSTEELLDLYAETYKSSLRGQVFDLSSLVAPGNFVVQMGYSFSTDRDELDFTTTEHTFPEYLFRYRPFKRLELRAGWAGVAINELTDELTDITDRDTRAINPTVGMRLGLWKQHGTLPRTSLTLSTPYDLEGAGGFRDRLNPVANFGYSWLLDQTTLLSGSTGVVWTLQDGQRFFDTQQTLSLAKFVNDNWDLHVTWTGLFPEGRNIEDVNHSIGPGFSYRFTKKKQLDVLTAFGLDEPSPDFGLRILFTTRL